MKFLLQLLSCEACGAALPPDPVAVHRHADSHLTETGVCRVCGALFTDRAASATHTLAHVGVRLFTCGMCRMEFCSQRKLLRHHRHTACSYSLPQGALHTSSTGSGGDDHDHDLGLELQCAACNKTLSSDFQVGGLMLRHTEL